MVRVEGLSMAAVGRRLQRTEWTRLQRYVGCLLIPNCTNRRLP